MKRYLIILHLLLVAVAAQGQGLFERFPNRPEATSALLLSYNGEFDIKGFGSGSLYFVPLDTNDQRRLVCVVTADHNLRDKETGKPFDGLLIKVNASRDNKPIYLKVPLHHTEPRNYWKSPSGLDLAVIPLPNSLISGSDVLTFKEDQILTPNNAKERGVSSGLIVQALCMQPEYMDAIDFVMPETLPTLRIGHLSRPGFYETKEGIHLVRPHVIDMHSSPGNSGATVILLVPKPDNSETQPMFLGIIQGFKEEKGSYVPYDAMITNRTEPVSMLLVNQLSGDTNQVALAFKTIANPDLTSVIPVHELVNLRTSHDFLVSVVLMIQNQHLYQRYDAFPTPASGAQQEPPRDSVTAARSPSP